MWAVHTAFKYQHILGKKQQGTVSEHVNIIVIWLLSLDALKIFKIHEYANIIC